jgi:RNA polymerase sigma factor for flagellar operon FliA
MQASSSLARATYPASHALAAPAARRAVARRPAPAPAGERPLHPREPQVSLFVRHQHLIEDVVRHVIRRRGLRQNEAEDFASAVTVRLLDNECAVLRCFEGRSSLRTFLTRVIERLLLDHRIQNWGKWRPSAQAKRLGPLAMQLESLISRDGLTFSEAAETLRTNFMVPQTTEQLRRLYSVLPQRSRRRAVSDRDLEELPASAPSPDECLRQPEAARAILGLRRALSNLDPVDRALIEARFVRGLRPVRIAAIQGLPQMKLYRRLSSILKQLRVDLEAQGITWLDVAGCIPALHDEPVRGSVLPFRK